MIVLLDFDQKITRVLHVWAQKSPDTPGSPEGMKLQYFGHLMRRFDLLEKTLMLGGIEGRRRGDDRR